jgi:hypothetical protein
MNQYELREIVERSWQQLDAAIDGIDDAGMLEPGVVDGWSLKDLLAHVSIWEQLALQHVEQWRSGQPVVGLGDMSVDDYNARESARRRSWSLQQVRAEADETRRRLREMLASLTDEDWNAIAGEGQDQGPLGEWIGGALNGDQGPGTHAGEHAEQILAWRAARFKDHAAAKPASAAH